MGLLQVFLSILKVNSTTLKEIAKIMQILLSKWSDHDPYPNPVQLFLIRPGQKVPDLDPQHCLSGTLC